MPRPISDRASLRFLAYLLACLLLVACGDAESDASPDASGEVEPRDPKDDDDKQEEEKEEEERDPVDCEAELVFELGAPEPGEVRAALGEERAARVGAVLSECGEAAIVSPGALVIDAPIEGSGALTLASGAGVSIEAELTIASLAIRYCTAPEACVVPEDDEDESERGELRYMLRGGKVNLPAGETFSICAGEDCDHPEAARVYTVITALGEPGDALEAPEEMTLQGLAAPTSLNGAYALGADIAAEATASWNDGAGFQPIGESSDDDDARAFSGIFDGLGHTITGLGIHRPEASYVGLFGYVETHDDDDDAGPREYAELRHLELVDAYVVGDAYVGTLVGGTGSCIVDRVRASGVVTGHGNTVGGLMGWHGYRSVVDSSADVEVSGVRAVGGFSGSGGGQVLRVFATGDVHGEEDVGGLIGSFSYGTLSDAYASGKVTSQADAGGLIGFEYFSIMKRVYATGDVRGENLVGGLIGLLSGYSLAEAYSIGKVEGGESAEVGGLVGDGSVGPSTNFWAVDSSGQGESPVGQGVTLAELMLMSTFTEIEPAWDISTALDGDSKWYLDEGSTTPQLRALLQ